MYNKANKTTYNFFVTLFCVSIIFFIIITSVYIICFFDKNMLMNLLVKYNTKSYLPFSISENDLYKIQSELMSYLSGKMPFLNTSVTINDTITDFYSIRSKIHIGDVRNIFLSLIKINYLFIFLSIISFFGIIRTNNEPFNDIRKTYVKTLSIILTIIIACTIYAILNFDSFFTNFHKILFTNDYWLLDPTIDYIICLLPEIIFIVIGIRILALIFLVFIVLYFVFHFLSKIQLPQEAK